jgi:SSS family solute:Na+ symporter
VLAYTILGGMVSVVITDYVQFVVLSFGMLAACLFAVNHLGWANIVETVGEVHGEAGFDPLDTKGFGPSYVMWMIFVAGLVGGAIWPTALMRACAVESVQVVKRLYVWSSIGFLIRNLLPNFLGICALVFLFQHTALKPEFFEPAKSNAKPADSAETSPAGQNGDSAARPPQWQVTKDSDMRLRAMPVLLSQILPVGLIGLVGAGMLAAFMSTHDSYLLCWSSVLVEDVVNPSMRRPLSNKARITLARVFIFLIGAFLLVWSLWYPLKLDLWDYMAVSGAIYFTGAFALLLGGLYWKRASRVGAYLALGAGAINIFSLKPVKAAAETALANLGFKLDLSGVDSEHVGLTSVVLCVGLMIVGSLLFPDKNKPAESQS